MMVGIDPNTLANNELESTNINYQNEKGFPKIIDIKEDTKTNDVYVKAFLLNDKINKNFWNIPNESIEKYATGFIGKPLISHPSGDHPDYIKEGAVDDTDINEVLQIQQKFKIGEIIDVKRESIRGAAAAGEDAWFAYIRMTNPEATQAIKSGSMSFYVSPQVYDTADVVTDTTKDFVPLHLAVVNEPAYGNTAKIKAFCNGSGAKCTKALRSAATNLVDEIVKYTGNDNSSFVQKSDNLNHKLSNPAELNNQIGMGTPGANTNSGNLVSYKTQSESVGPNGEKIIRKEEQNTQQNVTNPARVGTKSEDETASVGGSNQINTQSSLANNSAPQSVPAVDTSTQTNSVGSAVTGSGAPTAAAAAPAQSPATDLQLPAHIMAALEKIPQLEKEVNEGRTFRESISQERQKKAGEEQLALIQSFFTPEAVADETARNELINKFAALGLGNEDLQWILEMIMTGGFKSSSLEKDGTKGKDKKHQIKSAAVQNAAIWGEDLTNYGYNMNRNVDVIGDNEVNWDNIK